MPAAAAAAEEAETSSHSHRRDHDGKAAAGNDYCQAGRSRRRDDGEEEEEDSLSSSKTAGGDSNKGTKRRRGRTKDERPRSFLSVQLLWLSVVMASFLPSPSFAQQRGSGKKPPMNPQLMQELCKNFTVGNVREQEFYSPGHPSLYPSDITCNRVLSAPPGYFVQVDFRDQFRLEPPNTDGRCQYDYLEIRDGEHGYSPLIKKKHCGNRFPERVVSSGTSLWMRFESDSTIEYSGFRAVYTFIKNPMPPVADIGDCSFNISGDQVTFGHVNISQVRKNHSVSNNVPLDCVWRVSVPLGDTIYMQIPEYTLVHPNDCNLNYIQIFDGATDKKHLRAKFCGSIAEAFTSKSSDVFVRFFAEVQGIDSEFMVVATTFTPTSEDKPCDKKIYYDCEDENCISQSLLCNGVSNCKFGWDEENCAKSEDAPALMDVASPHVIVILVVLVLILLGMCTGMAWNLRRMIAEDREELAASKASLNAVGISALVAAGDPGENNGRIGGGVSRPPGHVILPGDLENLPAPPAPKLKGSGGSGSGTLSAGGGDGNGGCYVPDAGFPLNTRF